ncbi:MAG: GGDEF domain-containing protein [Asticcacaulis sp.]|uniref:GGDEF domain-containing protein n=1 Tax=Asticcacaulis sp. TaxID=1872648 RepID=UPI0039E5E800
MTSATIIRLSDRMGLDSHLQNTEETSETGQTAPAAERPARATTASMQSLLAHYFETNPPVQDTAPFEAVRLDALSTPVSAPTGSPSAQAQQPEETSAAPSQDWPASAQTLIDSLRQENERLREQLREQTLQLQNAQGLADSDVLTPTLNRRAFLREMQRAMADCRRYGEDACLIFLDMDGFKSINDAHGHAAGDAALIYVAQTLNASVREGDSVGRIGGDEFAILLRRADLQSSRIKAMKLEAELMMGTFEYGGLHLKTGGSFGVRAYAGQASAESWLSEADAAMFLVKKSSR